MCLFICILVYAVVLVLSISALLAEGNLNTSSDWAKVIFWPITVVVYFLGLILWVLIWYQEKYSKEYYYVYTKLKISLWIYFVVQ